MSSAVNWMVFMSTRAFEGPSLVCSISLYSLTRLAGSPAVFSGSVGVVPETLVGASSVTGTFSLMGSAIV
jgi:hypothetical protein